MEKSKKSCRPLEIYIRGVKLERLAGKDNKIFKIYNMKYYSGGDLALLELYPETYSEIEGKVIPACLPEPEDEEDLDNTERGKY